MTPDGVHASSGVAPGDRDQQQAAELADELEAASYAWNEYGAEREQDYRAARAAIAAALAAARAEEAARRETLVAKIEALADEMTEAIDSGYYGGSEYENAAARLRAVLDGEQR